MGSSFSCLFFFLLIPLPPRSTLFPYTTLFRSIPLTGIHVTLQCVQCHARADAGDFKGSDRKSTRLNSSHRCISYAVFCLKKKTRDAQKRAATHQLRPLASDQPITQRALGH